MLLPLLAAAALLAADPPAGDDSRATVEHLDDSAPAPAAEPATVAPSASDNPQRAAALTPREPTRRKSTSLIIGGLELAAGALAGYVGLAVGVALNVPHGGLSFPPDALDVVYLGVVPLVACAAFSWFAGLLDFSQRSIIGSALWALIGAGAGELVGLGVGALVGRAMYPSDDGAAGIVALFIAPAVAAFGAVLFMELFKPGEEVYATLDVGRARDGSLALGPALLMRF
jgi:hypothetical protein